MNKERLREAIMLSLGEASMCWSQVPSGVFDDQHAIKIGNRLLKIIEDMTIKPPLPPQPKPEPKPQPKPVPPEKPKPKP